MIVLSFGGKCGSLSTEMFDLGECFNGCSGPWSTYMLTIIFSMFYLQANYHRERNILNICKSSLNVWLWPCYFRI